MTRSGLPVNSLQPSNNTALGNADVQVTAGYTQNVLGFGWTDEVHVKMRELLSAEPANRPCKTHQPPGTRVP